jgi:hypothetical protein
MTLFQESHLLQHVLFSEHSSGCSGHSNALRFSGIKPIIADSRKIGNFQTIDARNVERLLTSR